MKQPAAISRRQGQRPRNALKKRSVDVHHSLCIARCAAKVNASTQNTLAQHTNTHVNTRLAAGSQPRHKHNSLFALSTISSRQKERRHNFNPRGGTKISATEEREAPSPTFKQSIPGGKRRIQVTVRTCTWMVSVEQPASQEATG